MLCRNCKEEGDILYTKEFIPYHKECVNDPSILYGVTEVFNSLDEEAQEKLLKIAYKPVTFTPNIAEAFHIMEMLEGNEDPGEAILTFLNFLVTSGQQHKSVTAEQRAKELLQRKIRSRNYEVDEEESEQEEELWIL